MEADAECKLCKGETFFELSGSADPRDFMETDDADDVLRAASCIFYAREKPWSPTELMAQPAKWARAYEMMLPYVLRSLEEVREQHRQRAARSRGGSNG